MLSRLVILFAAALVMSACSSESAVLTPTFRFFVPFGESKGAMGSAVVTNDRMPMVGTCVVHDDQLAMFDRETGRILVFSTDGKLRIDRVLDKLETKNAWPAPVLAVGTAGAWLAKAEGSAEKRKYRVHAVPDDTSPVTTAVVFPATSEEILGKGDESIEHILMERLIPHDSEKLIAVWHGVTRRGNADIVSAIAFSIADLATRKITSHRINFEEIKKTESGDARFDTVTSVHHFTDARRFVIEVQYRKADIRNPFEKALFLLDIEKNTLSKTDLPPAHWNAFAGIARDGSLFFIEDVLMHNTSTRAIISIYRMDTAKEARYAIEADPSRPTLGNFVFSREGALYGYDVFDRGVNFYSWK